MKFKRCIISVQKGEPCLLINNPISEEGGELISLLMDTIFFEDLEWRWSAGAEAIESDCVCKADIDALWDAGDYIFEITVTEEVIHF